MELRQLMRILLRRWWLILIPALVLGVVGIITYQPAPASYAATMRFAIGYEPQPSEQSLYDGFYAAWLASEYIAGGLSDWSRTGDFAQAVADDLTQNGHDVSPATVAASLVSDHQRSIVTLYFNGSDAALLQSIAESAARVLQSRNALVFPQNGPEGAAVTALDGATVGAAAPPLRSRLELPIRIALAIVVGIVLALIAHYFDATIHERHEVELLGWSIVGEIPKHKRG